MDGANLVWVEQIWSGWSKFGVGGVDVGRTVWRVADNLEKTLLCKFLFLWAKFLKLDTVGRQLSELQLSNTLVNRTLREATPTII